MTALIHIFRKIQILKIIQVCWKSAFCEIFVSVTKVRDLHESAAELCMVKDSLKEYFAKHVPVVKKQPQWQDENDYTLGTLVHVI